MHGTLDGEGTGHAGALWSSLSQVVFIPIGLRNQKWERIPLFWHATVGHSVAPEFIMPPRRTGFNEYMPQGQRTLTEVDGVVEIGPVGPATQKEVAPAQANTSRKRDAAPEAAAQPAAARRAARDHATAAQGRSGRQPAAILSDPVFKAGCTFEHMRWPSFDRESQSVHLTTLATTASV